MWETLKLMHQYGVNFCLQHRGKEGWYNLSITDPKGKQHVVSSNNIKDIEQTIEVMYGHLEKPLPLPLPKL